MANFTQKVGLKILNKAGYNSISGLFSVHIKAIDNLIFLHSVGILQVLRFEFLKIRILETYDFHPCNTRFILGG